MSEQILQCDLGAGTKAHRAAIDLGQREESVVGGDDRVARAADADAAADHELVDRDDHRNLAVAHRLEGQVIAAVEQSDAFGMRLHLLDVDPTAKAARVFGGAR